MDLRKKSLPIVLMALLFIITKATKEEHICLAKDDKRWDPVKEKCRKCKPCAFGKGRNYTNVLDIASKEHGDLKCIRCRLCPKGTFDVKYNNDCQPCDMEKCAKQHRNIQTQCNNHHDVTCGSCLSGYYDEYKSSDFPCSPEKVTKKDTLRPIPTQSVKSPSSTPTTRNKNKIHMDGNVLELQSKQENSDDVPNNTESMGMIIASTLAILVVLSIVAVFLIIRRRNTRTRITVADSLTSVPESGSLINYEQDVEIDGPKQTWTEGRVQRDKYDVIGEAVRGEIVPASFIQLPRPELSHGLRSSVIGPSCIGPTTLATHSRKYNQVCHCDLSNDNLKCLTCQKDIAAFCDVIIQKGDKLVSIVSSNICHDPVTLFHELKIPDSAIYQIDDDRQRHPDELSQKECIQRTLNKWLELEHEQVDLDKLSKALCACKYHHINSKIREYINDSIRQEDLADDDTHSVASML